MFEIEFDAKMIKPKQQHMLLLNVPIVKHDFIKWTKAEK